MAHKIPLTPLALLATLPDFWGPMDPIGVQKSDSPRERAAILRVCAPALSPGERVTRCRRFHQPERAG
jgi:hypothetical protein